MDTDKMIRKLTRIVQTEDRAYRADLLHYETDDLRTLRNANKADVAEVCAAFGVAYVDIELTTKRIMLDDLKDMILYQPEFARMWIQRRADA